MPGSSGEGRSSKVDSDVQPRSSLRATRIEGTWKVFLDEAERAHLSDFRNKVKPSFTRSKDREESFKTIERLYEKKELITGVLQGLKTSIKRTAGFQPSDLIIVAGRPVWARPPFASTSSSTQPSKKRSRPPSSHWKCLKSNSSFACSVRKPIVEGTRLRTGFLTESDWPKLTLAAGNLSDAPIYIDDTAALSALRAKAKAGASTRRQGLGHDRR